MADPHHPQRDHQRKPPSATPQGNELHRWLQMIRGPDIAKVPRASQERRQKLERRMRQARYEDCALAVAIIDAIAQDPRVMGYFADAFQQEVGRELKLDWLNREAFLFVHGEARKDLAGSDAIALADAIAQQVAPSEIPAHIEANGGLQKLLKAERARRDRLTIVEFSIRESNLKRLDTLHLGGNRAVIVMRSRLDKPKTTKFAIKLE